jgi:branched-chain amino acid transport system permease protein
VDYSSLTLNLLLQLFINGIVAGGIYAMIALGLSLIVGVSKIMNFAQGEIMMLGMYLTFVLNTEIGLSPLLALPIVFLAMIPLALLLFLGLFKPLLDRGFNAQVISTLGLSIFLISAVTLAFGSDLRSLHSVYSISSFEFFGARVRQAEAFGVIYTFASSIIIGLFLSKTRLGISVRAVAEEPYAAELLGIPVSKVYALSVSLAFALTAGAGVFLASYSPTYPTVGQTFVILAFVAITIGGLGSIPGSVIGGLVIGFVQSLVSFVFTPVISDIAIFIAFIAILVLRPNGIFGIKTRI